MPSKKNSLLPSEKIWRPHWSIFCRQSMLTKPAVCFDHLPWPVLSQPFSSHTPFLFQAFGPVRPLEASGPSGLDPIPRVVRVCASVIIQGRLSHLLVSMPLGCLPTDHARPPGVLLVETLTRNWRFYLAKLGRESEMDTRKAILDTLSWTTLCREPLRANEGFPAWLANNLEGTFVRMKEE